MIVRRPPRILLAAAVLGIAGVVTLVGVVGPNIASVVECGPLCTLKLGVSEILRLATPFVAIALAAGLLASPRNLTRPAAVLGGLLALGWIGPVASATTLVTVVALSLFSAAPFLLFKPVGIGARRWARWVWIGTILAGLILWLLDMSFSGLMQTTPVAPQMSFLAVAATVLGAGMASGYVDRLQTAGRTANGTNAARDERNGAGQSAS